MASRKELKVGAFVIAGLATMGLTVFMIGEERQMFSDKQPFYSTFEDVQGLRRGSPVRMGGVDIGAVTQVAYPEDAKDKRIHVKMSVVEAESRRIRSDSVATIEGKGLLGDKMIVITVGSMNKPQVPVGGLVRSEPAQDLSQMMSKLSSISNQVEKVVVNLERTTGAFADEKFHEDLKTGVHSLSNILGSIDRGEGYVGKIVSDPNEAQRLSRVMANLEKVTADLDKTTAGVNAIIGRVQQGPGFAHEVIYGEEGSKAVAQFGNAADELRLTLKGIRDGNGIARSVIYGDDQSQRVMGNLNDMSGDLKQIVADMRAGKGTLGALLVDPSVYEDLKMVLGNVERNKALRALVRYSIRRDERAPAVEVRDPAPAQKPAGAASARASGE
jgi:phospholipid/cholesterol/gamma-HCH transport system substrate-binding protein